MEITLNKESFLDEFKKVRSIENKSVSDRTEGFLYLHNATICRLANGKNVDVDKLDFEKFTYEDLRDYMRYYENYLLPKIDMVHNLFSIVRSSESMFSNSKQFC